MFILNKVELNVQVKETGNSCVESQSHHCYFSCLFVEIDLKSKFFTGVIIYNLTVCSKGNQVLTI
jgi:hypothetical protein